MTGDQETCPQPVPVRHVSASCRAALLAAKLFAAPRRRHSVTIDPPGAEAWLPSEAGLEHAFGPGLVQRVVFVLIALPIPKKFQKTSFRPSANPAGRPRDLPRILNQTASLAVGGWLVLRSGQASSILRPCSHLCPVTHNKWNETVSGCQHLVLPLLFNLHHNRTRLPFPYRARQASSASYPSP